MSTVMKPTILVLTLRSRYVSKSQLYGGNDPLDNGRRESSDW